MRFTVIGHSCLYFETPAGTILVDPWLIGSCYWRSWWHFPPSAEPRHEWFEPDYIYLTHHHFDHFHYPSMRKIDRGARVLIPQFGVEVMRKEVESLGFEHVTELPHGEVTDLGQGVKVASYQYGFDDTTFVVADGPNVVVDVNDCKIRDRSLRRVLEAFGRPTFVLKSYSFAQSYPLGYTAEDPADLELVTRQTYVDDFVGRVAEFRPKYAVPFGSMVAFLHPETRDLNQHLIPPGDIVTAFRRSPAAKRTEVLEMAPGDSWDSEQGFSIAGRDWYSERDKHLEELAESLHASLEAQAAAEEGVTADWDKFEAYFTSFVRALPPLTGRFAVRRPIVFKIPSCTQTPYWIIDIPKRSVHRAVNAPAERAETIHVPEALLVDAIDKRVVQLLHGAMRIRTELRAGALSDDLTFWGLIAIWENGYLDWRALPKRRLARVLWHRRAEVFDAVRALVGRGSFVDRMANRFAEAPDAERALDPPRT
jgi:UDP-MurNAc hydroxylase